MIDLFILPIKFKITTLKASVKKIICSYWHCIGRKEQCRIKGSATNTTSIFLWNQAEMISSYWLQWLEINAGYFLINIKCKICFILSFYYFATFLCMDYPTSQAFHGFFSHFVVWLSLKSTISSRVATCIDSNKRFIFKHKPWASWNTSAVMYNQHLFRIRIRRAFW